MTNRRELLQYAATIAALACGSFGPANAQAEKMKVVRIPNSGLKVSRIAYGTGFLDFSWHKDPDFIKKGVNAINVAYDNGITFFDSADVYGHGKSEVALGSFLKTSPKMRESVVIQSKCGLRIAPDWEMGDPILTDISGAHISRAVEGSLKRLGTDYLDIFMLHAPDILFNPEEIAEVFDRLNSAGKVRYFGVSNFGVAHIELLKKYLKQPLVANQIPLGLTHFGAISKGADGGTGGVVNYCWLHNMQVQAFSPLRGGLLNPPADATAQFKKVAQLLKDLAKEKNTNASAIALAWIMRHPAQIVPIIGTTNPQYIVENCQADQVEITHDEWHQLYSAASQIQRG